MLAKEGLRAKQQISKDKEALYQDKICCAEYLKIIGNKFCFLQKFIVNKTFEFSVRPLNLPFITRKQKHLIVL